MKTITYLKKSEYYCDPCGKMRKGEGYFIPIVRKAYCPKHYAEVFPKFKKEEEK